jgi:uncharacterized protein
MTEVVITVRGEDETRVAPEEGVVHITVRAEGSERGGVVERIAALAAPVRDDLAARKDAGGLADWSSRRVSVWSDRPWSDGKRLAPVHYASVELTATFRDVAALSWWVTEVAERDGLQIDGVDWRLTPETRAATERDVAAQAVHVAVSRASAYAEALGLTQVTPLQVADVGLLGDGASAAPAPPMLRAAKAMAMDAGSGPAMAFQPEDIIVSAAVEARFAAH